MFFLPYYIIDFFGRKGTNKRAKYKRKTKVFLFNSKREQFLRRLFHPKVEVTCGTAACRSALWCDASVVGCVIHDVAVLDYRALPTITVARHKLNGVLPVSFRWKGILGQKQVADRVVCTIGIAVVVGVLVVTLVGSHPVAAAVERVKADGPTVIGRVDESATRSLMSCEVYGVTSMQGDDAASLALHVVGITACGISKSKPCGAVGAVVVIAASVADNSHQAAEDNLLKFDSIHFELKEV